MRSIASSMVSPCATSAFDGGVDRRARRIDRGRERIEHEAADRQRLRSFDQDVRIFAAVDLERTQQRVGIIIHLEAVVLLEIRDGLRLLLEDHEPVRVLERGDRARPTCNSR